MKRLSSPLKLAVATLLALAACLAPTAFAAGRHPSPAIAAPSQADGATIAGIVVPALARSRPAAGHKIWRVGTATSWSSEPQFLLVLGSANHQSRQWLRVLLPIRPNHTTGWIPRDEVTLLRTRYWIIICSDHRSCPPPDPNG